MPRALLRSIAAVLAVLAVLGATGEALEMKVCALCCSLKTLHMQHAFDAAVAADPDGLTFPTGRRVRFTFGYYGGYHHGQFLESLLADVRGNAALTAPAPNASDGFTFADGRYTAGGCDVFLGPGSSNFAPSMNAVIPPRALWLDYGTTTPAMSDHVLYPSFSRVVPSMAVTARTTARVLVQLGWRRAHVLAGSDSFSADSLGAFGKAASVEGVALATTVRVTTATTEAELLTVVRGFATSDVRVVYVAMAARGLWDDLRALLSNATLGLARDLHVVLNGGLCSFTSRSRWDTIPGALCVAYGAEPHYPAFHASLAARNWSEEIAYFNAARGYAGRGPLTAAALTSTDRFAPYAADVAAFVVGGVMAFLRGVASAHNATAWSDLGSVALLNFLRSRVVHHGFTGPVALEYHGDRPAADLDVMNSVPAGVLPDGALSRRVGNASAVVVAGSDGEVTTQESHPALRIGDVFWSSGRSGLPVPSGVVLPVPPPGDDTAQLVAIVVAVVVAVLAGLLAAAGVAWHCSRKAGATATLRFAPTDDSKPFAAGFIAMRNAVPLRERYPVGAEQAFHAFHAAVAECAAEHRCHIHTAAPVSAAGDPHILLVAPSPQAVLRCVGAATQRLARHPWEAMFQRQAPKPAPRVEKAPAPATPAMPGDHHGGAVRLLAEKPRVAKPVKSRVSFSGARRSFCPPHRAMSKRPGRGAPAVMGSKAEAGPLFSSGVAWGRGSITSAGPAPSFGGLVVAHAAMLADMGAPGQVLTPCHVAAEAAGCVVADGAVLVESNAACNGVFQPLGWALLRLPPLLAMAVHEPAADASPADPAALRARKQQLQVQEIAAFLPAGGSGRAATAPSWALPDPPEDARREYHSGLAPMEATNPLAVSLPSTAELDSFDASDAVTRAVARAGTGVVVRHVAVVTVGAAVLAEEPSFGSRSGSGNTAASTDAAYRAVAKVARAHLATVQHYESGVFTITLGLTAEVAKAAERAGAVALAAVRALQRECETDDVWAGVASQPAMVHPLGDECVASLLGPVAASSRRLMGLARRLRPRSPVLSTVDLLGDAASFFLLQALDVALFAGRPRLLVSIRRLRVLPADASPWLYGSEQDVVASSTDDADDEGEGSAEESHTVGSDTVEESDGSDSRSKGSSGLPRRTTTSSANVAMAALFDLCWDDDATRPLLAPFESPLVAATLRRAWGWLRGLEHGAAAASPDDSPAVVEQVPVRPCRAAGGGLDPALVATAAAALHMATEGIDTDVAALALPRILTAAAAASPVVGQKQLRFIIAFLAAARGDPAAPLSAAEALELYAAARTSHLGLYDVAHRGAV